MTAEAGLCDACVWQRRVISGRGSEFVLCERSRLDPEYVRYPPLPVLRCAGFQSKSGESSS